MLEIAPSESLHRNHLRYRELASIYCEYLERGGISALPWHNPALPHFQKLASSQQLILLHGLEAQIKVAQISLQNGGSLMDSWSLILAFLEEMKLTPAPDLLSHVAPDDYIAVYNQFGGMIYLTPNHLKLMSYSLEDLYCRSWIEIFRRDPRIEKVLLERVMGFVQGKRTHTLSNEDIPAHYLEETDSPGMRAATGRSKIYSPVFRDGKPSGFLAVNNTIASTSRVMPRP